ncbi:MAG: response regulator [Bacteroidia bacterium]|nr:response regulator [Bacteroidia bacterium]MCZ2276395.1 response regulator [Bacteroidia bacterium]
MNRYTYVKIIAILTGSISLLGVAYFLFIKNNNTLLAKVDEATRPDELLVQIRNLNDDINLAESSVRAFALSQDTVHSNLYDDFKEKIGKRVAFIRSSTHSNPELRQITDTLAELLHLKLNHYDKLLDITHQRITDTALTRILEVTGTDSIYIPDSLSEQNMDILFRTNEQKRSFFNRLFTSDKKKQNELRTLIEKAELDREKKQAELIKHVETNKHITETLNKQYLRLQNLNRQELQLLEDDKKVSAKINNLTKDLEELRQQQNEKRINTARSFVFHSSSSIQWILISGSVLILLLTLLLIRDTIKADLYREDLDAAKKKAEDMAHARQQFLSTMSHEIRTPLTAISGYSNLLSKSPLNKQQSQYLDFINDSADHLLKIVNDILELSRLDSGKLKLEKTPFSPAAVAEDVCDLLRLKANEKDVILSCGTSAIQNLTVGGDPFKLRQILLNLIGNAVKFTQKGSVTLECLPEKETELQTNLKFIIRDTGIGMAEEQLNNLFSEFNQADETISRRFGGSGLGLSITHKLVTLHAGSIKVKSIEKMGTEITVCIPYTVSQPLKVTEKDKQKEIKLKTQTLNGIKVLLADDVFINRLLQKEVLEQAGAEVETAGSGYAIIEYLRQHPGEVDVVILDLQMPGLSGPVTAKKIHEELDADMPLIATTANPVITDSENLTSSGFKQVLVKPFSEAELTKCILSLLSDKIIDSTVSEKLYDTRELELTSRGNSDFVHRMMKIFLFSAESMIGKLEKAVSEKQLELLVATAHRLAPSCRQLSIDYMADRLKWIEEHATSPNEIDWNKIKKKIKELQNHFREIKTSMDKEFIGFTQS